MAADDNKLMLSPLTRLMMTFDNELRLDGGRVFDAEFYARLLGMLGLIEKRRDQMLRTMLV